MKKTSLERFTEKYESEPSSGCWLWCANAPDRYGQFRDQGKTWQAHRWSAKHLGHQDIENRVVRHLCNNPLCVNPDHLEPGTQKENVQDAVRAGRVARGERNGASKLTAAAVRAIREASGTQAQIAKEHGVTQQLISAVRLRKVWV